MRGLLQLLWLAGFVQVAIGECPPHDFVNLLQIARYHGVLNSVGFGLCSLVGWTLLRRKKELA